LNADIVDAMSTVNELMPSPAGTAAVPVDVEVDVDGEDAAEVAVVGELAGVEVVELDDEQPAAVRAASATATPATPTRR
jgi:hypothetical protein